MNEEIKILIDNVVSLMADVENYVFTNFKSRYTLIKSQIDSYRDAIEDMQNDLLVNPQAETIDSVKNDLNKIMDTIKSSELYQKMSMGADVQTELANPNTTDNPMVNDEFIIPTPTVENVVDSSNTSETPAASEEQPTNTSEVDDLLNMLDKTELETVYPQKDVPSSENIDNVLDTFAKIDETPAANFDDLDTAAIEDFLNNIDNNAQ